MKCCHYLPTGHMLILHSQSEVVPTCPDGFPLVASGYSFLQTSDSSFGVATQDLGSMGSCLSHFSTSLCADTSCVSYWLASNTSNVEQSDTLSRTISRCSVCLLTSNILTIHSLKHELPECPIGWNTLWDGYSFISVSVQYCYNASWNFIVSIPFSKNLPTLQQVCKVYHLLARVYRSW